MPVVGSMVHTMVMMLNRSVMHNPVATTAAMMHVIQMKRKMLAAGQAQQHNARYNYNFPKILVHGVWIQGVVPVHLSSAPARSICLIFSTFSMKWHNKA